MKTKNNLIYVILTVFTTLLFIDRFMVYGIGLLVILYFLLSGKKLVLYKTKLFYVFIAILIVTFIAAVLSFTGFSSIYNAAVDRKEIYRAIIYIIIMEMMVIIEVNIKVYSTIWRVLLFFIVGVAIIQWIKIFDVDSILKSIYGNSVQFINSANTDISTFRCGSVFVNPNVFACFLVAALASYLFLLRYKYETVVMKIITFGLILTGFVLSGSRTGLILAVIIILFYMYNISKKNITIFVRNIFFLIISIAVVLGILVMFFNVQLSDFSAFRMFQIQAGTSNSLGGKIYIFKNLLRNMNVVNMVIGYGPFNYALDSSLMVDFDFGYFATFYGLVGVFIHIALIRGIYRWGDIELSGRILLNRLFMLITIFFGITAGVYFNLRIFVIYMLMFLPMIRADGERVT